MVVPVLSLFLAEFARNIANPLKNTPQAGISHLFPVWNLKRAWNVSVEERREPIHGGLTAASLLPTSSPNTPHALSTVKMLKLGNFSILIHR